jgi:hypothetical protein
MEQHNFNIGDRVQVRDIGYLYTTYTHMFNKFNFPPQSSPYYAADIGDVGIVIGLAYHEDDGQPLVAVKTINNHHFLIGSDGITTEIDESKAAKTMIQVVGHTEETDEKIFVFTTKELIKFTRTIQQRTLNTALEGIPASSVDIEDYITLDLNYNNQIDIEVDEEGIYKEIQNNVKDVIEDNDDDVMDEALDVLKNLN